MSGLVAECSFGSATVQGENEVLLEEIGIGLGTGLECDFTLNAPTLKALIEVVRRRYSLAHAGYLCPGFNGVNYKEPIGAVTYSDDWIAHYQKENYFAVDPVVMMGATSILPFEWRQMQIQGRRAKRLYAEAGCRAPFCSENSVPAKTVI